MTENVNPALIIGLGGTGQWVLTYVKKNLLERFQSIPPQIKLLAFDTTGGETEVNKGLKFDENEEIAKIGSIRLDPTEFIYLGGNIKRICEQVRQGQHKHLQNWLQADAYLGGRNNQIGFEDDAFNLSRGAGTRRQFGRMSIFFDLLQHNDTKLLGKLSDSLQEIIAHHAKSEPVNVFVVSSVAGGTGSGMLIDIAHLIRFIAQEKVGTDIILYGLIVLPNIFQPVINVNHVKPQSFAAIRELNRFMTMFGEEYPIDYTDESSYLELHTVYRSKLFDNCFLLDSERSRRAPQNTKPQHGVFPSVADSITMLLDPSAGDTFQQHYKNVNNRVAALHKRKKIALYSSVGTYSYIFPVEDIIQASCLRFARKFLEDFFVPIAKKNSPSNNSDSKENALGFLLQSASRSGIQNTAFMHEVAEAVGGSGSNNIEELQKYISKGRTLLACLEPTGEDAATQQYKDKLQMLAKFHLSDEIKTSREWGDSYESGAIRIPEHADAFKARYFGTLDVSNGKRQNGELKNILEQISKRHEFQYKNLLLEHVNQLFDPTWTGLPYARITYVQGFLSYLVNIFDEYALLMDRARQLRNREGALVYWRSQSQIALSDLQESKRKVSILGTFARKLGGNGIEDTAQENYIRAVHNEIESEIEDITFGALFAISRSHQILTRNLLNEVNNWIVLWSTGNPASNISGVLRRIQDSMASLEQLREEKRLVPVHCYLTDDQYEETVFNLLSDGKFNHLLDRFQWSCVEQGDKLGVQLELDKQPLSSIIGRQQSVEENYRTLISVARAYFADLGRETIASRLSELYDADKLAIEIMENAAPMIDVQPENAAGMDQEKQLFVCLNKREAINFLETTERVLKRHANKIKDAQLIESSDPYRCVIVSTADLLGVDAIASIEDAREWYDTYPGDKRQLHIFPAEVHAMEFEGRLSDHPFYYETLRHHHLNPRLVMLLEDLNKFELFVKCYALGIVRIEDSPDQHRLRQYFLRVQRKRSFDRSAEIPLTEPAVRPSIFQAIHSFVLKRPLKPEANVEDLIVAVDNRRTHKSNVNDAIRTYEELIQRGLGYTSRQFGLYIEQRLRPIRAVSPALENEFQYYLLDQVDHSEFSPNSEEFRKALATKTKNWMIGLKDMVAYNQELTEHAIHLVENALSMQKSIEPLRLKRHFEDFILNDVKIFTQSDSRDERDLGVLMHMVIWDYMGNLDNSSKRRATI